MNDFVVKASCFYYYKLFAVASILRTYNQNLFYLHINNKSCIFYLVVDLSDKTSLV